MQLKAQTRLRWSKGELHAGFLNRFDSKDSVTEMLSTLKWKTLESRRTIARLSLLCKMQHRLVSHKDANLQSAGNSYSTRPIEYSYTQPQPLGITTSIPSTQGQLQNEQTPKGYSIVQFAGCF